MAKDFSFEKSIEELENIVKTLEDGDISLDESLKIFEKGVKLSAECNKALDECEQKVNVLLRGKDGQISEENFIAGEDE